MTELTIEMLQDRLLYIARELFEAMKRETKYRAALDFIANIEKPAAIPVEAAEWHITSQQQTDAAVEALEQ